METGGSEEERRDAPGRGICFNDVDELELQVPGDDQRSPRTRSDAHSSIVATFKYSVSQKMSRL